MKICSWLAAGAVATLSGLLLGACGGDDGPADTGTTAATGGGQSRPITPFGDVPFGSECDGDVDCGGEEDSCCSGGKCSPEGWCSPKCDSDQDCPVGFFCVDWDGKRCFASCEDDRDCPTDFICEEKNEHRTCRYK